MNPDNIIKGILREKMLKIEDPAFTEKIVNIHLSGKAAIQAKPFLSFSTLILGMVAVVFSLGFVLLDFSTQFSDILGNYDSTSVIVLSISLVFLLYKWLEELTMKYPVNIVHDKSLPQP